MNLETLNYPVNNKIRLLDSFVYSVFTITLFVCLLTYSIESSTYVLIWSLPSTKIYLISIIIITLLGIITYKSSSLSNLIMYCAFYGVAVLSYITSNTLTILFIVTICFFSQNKDIKKILSIYFWIILISIFFIIGSSLSNHIINLFYTRADGSFLARKAMGFLHPNTLSLFILALNFAFYFRKSYLNLQLKDMWIGLISILITYFDARSYTVTLALIAIMGCIILTKIIHFNNISFNFSSKTKTIIISIIVFVIILLIIYIKKNSTNSFIEKLGSTVSSRLSFGNLGLNTYGISVIGQPVDFYTSSYMFLHPTYMVKYFTVDCWYVKLLINEGLLGSIIIIGLVLIDLKHAMDKKNIFQFSLIIILLLYSMFETGLGTPIMTFVFAMCFSKLSVKS